ncbi:hypothetical protein [Rhodoferax sp.]|uniref:hypothetical protein n=1 Tax=Rhodoferax sp. TaxID=50421 RepID=UPI0027293D2A|nr:hypothetical protein [Rhodoferax sp.]MDO9199527.1 hypothetical protein [Rhodoferax sp.]
MELIKATQTHAPADSLIQLTVSNRQERANNARATHAIDTRLCTTCGDGPMVKGLSQGAAKARQMKIAVSVRARQNACMVKGL